MRVFLYIYGKMCACQGAHVEVQGQGSQFSPSTPWVLRPELRASHFKVVPLLTGPSLWPFIFFFNLRVYMCKVHAQVHTCKPEHVCIMWVFIPCIGMHVSVCAQRPQHPGSWSSPPTLLETVCCYPLCLPTSSPWFSRDSLPLLPISSLLHKFSAIYFWNTPIPLAGNTSEWHLRTSQILFF